MNHTAPHILLLYLKHFNVTTTIYFYISKHLLEAVSDEDDVLIDGTEDNLVEEVDGTETLASTRLSFDEIGVDNASIPPPIENDNTNEESTRRKNDEWESNEKLLQEKDDQEVISHLPEWLQEKFKEVMVDADKERERIALESRGE